jgi:tellurite resistance protein
MSTVRIERLRDALLEGGLPSVRPPAAEVTNSPECEALYARVRPFAEVMFLVMTADEAIDVRERDALRGALRSLTGGQLSTSAMEQMIAEFELLLTRHGADVRLDYVASVLYSDRSDRELAVSLATAAALADGTLLPCEHQTIRGLAERLNISKDRLRELVGDVS